jgi:hypothetical protein
MNPLLAVLTRFVQVLGLVGYQKVVSVPSTQNLIGTGLRFWNKFRTSTEVKVWFENQVAN